MWQVKPGIRYSVEDLCESVYQSISGTKYISEVRGALVSLINRGDLELDDEFLVRLPTEDVDED